MCERFATTPPMGIPLPIGLPIVAMSASMFQRWWPHIASPVRPKPGCTSSQMTNPPARCTTATASASESGSQ